MLTEFPVQWTAPEVRQTLDLLTDAVYREADIVPLVRDAGLPIGQVAFDARADLTWRSVFSVAAGQGRVGELLDVVETAYPSLQVRLDELRENDPS